MTRTLLRLGLPALALTLAACGGGHPAAPGAGAGAPDLGAGDLKSRLVGAPTGFAPSHEDGDIDGTITAADFDDLTDTGAAQELGFTTGEGETFAKGTTEVEFDLLRFSSASNAGKVVDGFRHSDPSDTSKPVIGTDPAIPGSVTVTPTLAEPSGQQEYDLFVQVGSGVMVTSLYVDALGPDSATLAQSLERAQYQKLVG